MDGTSLDLQSGATLIREGEPADCAYIIESGRMRVSRDVNGASILLAELGPGELVGEMGMITEKPRSATVTALEPARVRRIERHTFLEALQSDRDTAVTVLRVLFDRLRQADARLTQLEEERLQRRAADPAAEQRNDTGVVARLTARTSQASDALGAEAVLINALPFRIGRRDDDPLSYNDLALNDGPPYQISRHHLVLLEEDGQLVIYDRGSSLGSTVRGQRLGGGCPFDGPVRLRAGETIELVLGHEQSPMQFAIEVIRG